MQHDFQPTHEEQPTWGRHWLACRLCGVKRFVGMEIPLATLNAETACRAAN